jgi:WD40 repeat protein
MSASADLTMFLWNVTTGEAIRQFNGHERVVYSVVFTRDGTQALSSARDKTLILWRVDDDERLLEWMHANRFTRDLTPAECDLYRVRCELLPAEAEATTEPASGS